jgi:endonuclease/exonuclease/phosphatase family metal-dependent hydrolase
MLDANQALKECYNKSTIKPHSIEWLQEQRGVDNPFVQLTGNRPNSTTQTPHRDIDYVLTFGINITNISTLEINDPCVSDHLGIIFDIDIASHFASRYSDIAQPPH